jgi:hypothetical protein
MTVQCLSILGMQQVASLAMAEFCGTAMKEREEMPNNGSLIVPSLRGGTTKQSATPPQIFNEHPIVYNFRLIST